MIADRGDAASPARLTRRHVEQALSYEQPREAAELVATMWRAARAFVDEAERRAPSARLALDLADTFRGLVLCAAVERHGRDDAFALLDQASLLRGRNHHRVLHRELERVRALLETVPGDVDPALTALVALPDDANE
jgi:hypothetical protein